jgi:hypothetical protein
VRRIVAVLGLAALIPGVAVADSDGYFCIGKGFVAYEMRSATARAGHFLHIVRVAHSTGITRLPPVALEDFQVHGMTCRDDGVDLHGWTTRYTVDIASAKPVVTATPAAFAQHRTPPPRSLGRARAGVFDIPSDGAPGEFRLVVALSTRAMASGLEHHIITQIFQRDESRPIGRQVVAAETLYSGIRLETGG